MLPLGEILKIDNTIRVIDFRATKIGVNGAYILSEVLSVNQTIETINLPNNNNLATK